MNELLPVRPLSRRAALSVAAGAAVLTLVAATVAHSAATAEQKCEAGKLYAAGKYAACAAKAGRSLALGGDPTAYNVAVGKCQTKLIASWDKLEAAAVASGTTCPSTGDQLEIENFTDFCMDGVAEEVTGGSLPPPAPTLRTGQTTCYLPGGGVTACAGTGQDGDLQPGVARSFVDNGDGTVTDESTGRMWEKVVIGPGIHDSDATYSWQDAFAVKIATLNSASFAGHNDWRLPTRFELETLVQLEDYSPASYPEIGTTRDAAYWTSTSHAFNPFQAWTVSFTAGDVDVAGKTTLLRVRAVRGGL